MTKDQENYASYLAWKEKVAELKKAGTMIVHNKKAPVRTAIVISEKVRNMIDHEKINQMLDTNRLEIVCINPYFYANMGEYKKMFDKVFAMADDITGGDFVEAARASEIEVMSAQPLKQMALLAA